MSWSTLKSRIAVAAGDVDGVAAVVAAEIEEGVGAGAAGHPVYVDLRGRPEMMTSLPPPPRRCY